MHYISRFIAGFAIGFLRVWQISLVTLSIVPLIAIAGGVYAYIATGLIARVRKSYIKAGEIAEEVITFSLIHSLLLATIRTRALVLCALISPSSPELLQPKKKNKKKGMIQEHLQVYQCLSKKRKKSVPLSEQGKGSFSP